MGFYSDKRIDRDEARMPKENEVKSIDKLRDILSQREEGYGGSEDTLNNIANLWSVYLNMRYGGAVTFDMAGDAVADMMVLLKIARSSGENSQSAQDDRLDQAGYALLGADLVEKSLK